jgi:hypothetical protein
MPHVLQVWTKYFQRVTTPLVYSVRHERNMRGDEMVEIPPLVWERLAAGAAEHRRAFEQAGEALRSWAEREQRSLERAAEALRPWAERLAETLRAGAQVWAKMPPPTEAEARALRRYSAALALGAANRRARPWLHLGSLMLPQLADFLPHLPDPTVRRGRPKGPGPAVAARLAEVADRLAVTDEKRTRVAKAVLRSRGVKEGTLKGPADHLARLLKREPK